MENTVEDNDTKNYFLDKNPVAYKTEHKLTSRIKSTLRRFCIAKKIIQSISSQPVGGNPFGKPPNKIAFRFIKVAKFQLLSSKENNLWLKSPQHDQLY